ncbi:hypothetical protein QO034_17225 [Sedimentitalea sp. JM2-8]|uniref:Uncharacterized protein n=1 Tax=Sedimentitalea xiamensis TaxID=3050037 RepID=A0ABT7FIA7_9RHOB|nr:hypothetical protein [Sedimentitalea xiamensis]
MIDFGDGDTISLSEPREVFQYADGSFGVISVGGDVIITADSPASVAQPGDGYVAHGMMHTDDIRIIEDTSAIHQGWDEMMSDQPKLIKPTFSTGYSAALNKAPSSTGASLLMATAGGTGSVVKVKRRASLPVSNGKYENAAVLEKVMIVHAVPAAPPIGSVRPPIMGVDLGLSAEDAAVGRSRLCPAERADRYFHLQELPGERPAFQHLRRRTPSRPVRRTFGLRAQHSVDLHGACGLVSVSSEHQRSRSQGSDRRVPAQGD